MGRFDSLMRVDRIRWYGIRGQDQGIIPGNSRSFSDAKVPYAAVVPHQAEVIFRQRFENDGRGIKARIESHYDGENLSAPLRFVVTSQRCMSV